MQILPCRVSFLLLLTLDHIIGVEGAVGFGGIDGIVTVSRRMPGRSAAGHTIVSEGNTVSGKFTRMIVRSPD
jgi:hypothetical protein